MIYYIWEIITSVYQGASQRFTVLHLLSSRPTLWLPSPPSPNPTPPQVSSWVSLVLAVVSQVLTQSRGTRNRLWSTLSLKRPDFLTKNVWKHHTTPPNSVVIAKQIQSCVVWWSCTSSSFLGEKYPETTISADLHTRELTKIKLWYDVLSVTPKLDGTGLKGCFYWNTSAI